jgi:hypothetical protein
MSRIESRRAWIPLGRRNFLKKSLFKSVAAVPLLAGIPSLAAPTAPPKMKITRVRAYLPPNFNPLFNQSNLVVTVKVARRIPWSSAPDGSSGRILPSRSTFGKTCTGHFFIRQVAKRYMP